MTKKDELPQYSKRIIALRERLGLSQKDLGLLANVTAPAITMWETGKRFPRGKNLRKLAEALQVSEAAIVDDSVPMPAPIERNKNKSQLIGDIVALLPALNKDQLGNILTLASGYTGATVDVSDIKVK